MVVAMPSDRSHLPLVEGTRSWRKVCHHDSCISHVVQSSFPNECYKTKDDSLHMPPGPTKTCISTSSHAVDQSCLTSIFSSLFFSFSTIRCLVPVGYNPYIFYLQKVEPCIGLAASLCAVRPSDLHMLTMACMDHLQLCSHAFTELSKAS